MTKKLFKNTIIASSLVLTLVTVTVCSSFAYAEKIVPLIPLLQGASVSMFVSKIQRTMSDNNEVIDYWVFCQFGECTTDVKTLPSPTLTMAAGTATNVTLLMGVAPQEDGSVGPRNVTSNPYIGHTIHLHGLDMESQYDGVPESYHRVIYKGCRLL